MIITKVKHLHTDQYEITVSREGQSQIQVEVDEVTLANYSLLKGKELNESEFVSILKEKEMRKLYSRAIVYLSRYRRTYYEVYSFLQKEEADEMLLRQAVNKLVEQNYINDSDYANDYTQTAKNVSYKGPGLIKRELTQKGIDIQLINSSLQDYSEEEQIICATKWVQKKTAAFLKYSLVERGNKIRQLLMRKGFSSQVISKVIEEVNNEEVHNEDSQKNERLNLEVTAEKYMRKYDKYDDYTKKRKLFAALARKGFSFDLIDEYLSNKE